MLVSVYSSLFIHILPLLEARTIPCSYLGFSLLLYIISLSTIQVINLRRVSDAFYPQWYGSLNLIKKEGSLYEL